jgi:hypothetical protein
MSHQEGYIRNSFGEIHPEGRKLRIKAYEYLRSRRANQFD